MSLSFIERVREGRGSDGKIDEGLEPPMAVC